MATSSASCPPLALEDRSHQLNQLSTPIPSRKQSPILCPIPTKGPFFVVQMIDAKNKHAGFLMSKGNYQSALQKAKDAEALAKKASIEIGHQIFISQKLQAFAWIKLSEIHSKQGEYGLAMAKSFKSERKTQEASQYDPKDPQVHLLIGLVCCELACSFNQEADALSKAGQKDQALVASCLAKGRARKGLKNPFISQNIRSLLEYQLVYAINSQRKLCDSSKNIKLSLLS